ncbi:MAG: XRE family transcriptional regulator [Pseudomonadota bacterium]
MPSVQRRDAGAVRSQADEVAAHIRELRVGAGLTLREIREATGLSISQISKLETGRARLTVDIALRLAGALRVPANAFFLSHDDTRQEAPPVVTRAGEAVGHRLHGIDYEVLCGEAEGKRALNWRVTVYGASMAACGGLRTHAGEEFIHVLSGTLELQVAESGPITLRPGDSIVFDGRLDHGYAAPDGPAVAIMTNSVIP